ncbi:DMT family transporter [Allonocardiopsis opalescens]|uniref:Threonine/homoserine efflux transporter RhtA n=1 Tax=Allonocardiopsis opalescens TaxID=1144618 RepID=A0A2T0PVA6_9ACTN|nr:DMT family transporter [Allonocardiopsis opalescens]PRX95462.1 threonine/homoserine efflux transporter RhtA [Allonocardiopsis opalescens]
MSVWAIGSAFAGAFFFAFGSALQERDAVGAPGRTLARLSLLLHLLSRPRWLIGTASVAVGVGLHLFALSHGTLTVVQPIGVSALLFAVVFAAVLKGHRVHLGDVVASVAVMLGLTGLLLAFPHVSIAPDLSTTEAWVLLLSVVAVGVGGFAAAHWVHGARRALLLAVLAGLAMGATSAFARVLGYEATQDPASLIGWMTLAPIGLAVFGGLLIQNAYRTGYFAAAYATLMVMDPVTGVGIGALVLGEPLPGDLPARVVAAVSAVVAVAGTVGLARATRGTHPDPEPASEEGGARPGAPDATAPERGASEQRPGSSDTNLTTFFSGDHS